jgi:hypothetical protein
MEVPIDLPETKEELWNDNEGRLCMTGQYILHAENLDEAEKNCPIKVGVAHPDSKEFKCVARNPIAATNHSGFWLVKAEFIQGV